MMNKISKFNILLVFFFFFYIVSLVFVPRILFDEAWESLIALNLLESSKLSMPQIRFPIDAGIDSTYFLHPPFYSYFLSYIYQFFGFDLLWGRLSSFVLAFCGILVFLKSQYLDKKLNKYILLIILVNPAFFILTRLIRPETLVFFLFCCSFFIYDKYYVTTGKKYLLFIVGILSGLALLTHIPGIVVVASFALHIFVNNLNSIKETLWKISLLFLGFILTIFPYIVYIYKNFAFFKFQLSYQFLSGINGGFISLGISVNNFLHPYLVFTIISLLLTLAFFIFSRNRGFQFSTLNVATCVSILFIAIYPNKNSYNMMIFVPLFVLTIFSMMDFFKNWQKIILYCVLGFNLLIIISLTIISFNYTSFDYKKDLFNNIPEGQKVFFNFEELFFFYGRNPYEIGPSLYNKNEDVFMDENDIKYVIKAEESLIESNLTKYRKVFEKKLNSYVISNKRFPTLNILERI